MDLVTKKSVVSREDKISINQQCEILDLTKSSYYYEPKEPSNEALVLMEIIKEVFEDRPTKGHRMIWQEHKKYPYLLRDIDITEPNQVWAADITYLKLPTGNCYFVGIIDWFSRKILSYRISNTLDAQFCIDALNEAIYNYGPPDIFNSDQGSQFTCSDFISVLKNHKINISMYSVGRWADNIIIERFFRTLKYEDFYLFKYETIKKTKIGIKNYIEYYNNHRKHSSLNYSTPNDFYNNFLKLAA